MRQVQQVDEVRGQSPFRAVPRTGVIFVMNEARKAGYQPDNPAWSNLGQGQPQTGELPGAPLSAAASPRDCCAADHGARAARTYNAHR